MDHSKVKYAVKQFRAVLSAEKNLETRERMLDRAVAGMTQEECSEYLRITDAILNPPVSAEDILRNEG